MRDNPAITGVELEELIARAARRDKEALNALLYCDWMTGLLDGLAEWSRRHFNVDGEEVRDHVFDQIHSQLEPLKTKTRRRRRRMKSPRTRRRKLWLTNARQIPWGACLKKWCFAVARNRALNMIAHREVEGRHAESVKHVHTIRIEDGVRIIEPSVSYLSPEEEVERKEQQDGLLSRIHERARHALATATEEDRLIVSLWSDGLTLKQIAAALDNATSIQTVSRKLRRFQQVVVTAMTEGIVEEIGAHRTEQSGVVQILEELVQERADLEELVASGAPGTPATCAPRAPAKGAETRCPDSPPLRRRRRSRCPICDVKRQALEALRRPRLIKRRESRYGSQAC